MAPWDTHRSHTLLGARAERNEYLLLHEFHKKKYICPDRAPFKKAAPVPDDDDGMCTALSVLCWWARGLTSRRPDERGGAAAKGKPGRRKAAYTGGLVLEPKRGYYDKYVLLLDFNSLYPSIIQEFNICFTTVQRALSAPPKEGNQHEDDDDDGAEVPMPEVPDSSLEPGVLPRILRTLVQRRRQVKALMKATNVDPADYAQVPHSTVPRPRCVCTCRCLCGRDDASTSWTFGSRHSS